MEKSYDLYIDRAMIEAEFDALWARQSALNPDAYKGERSKVWGRARRGECSRSRASRLDNPSAKAKTEAGLEFELILKIGGEDGTATQVSLGEFCRGKVDDVALLGLGLSESKEVLTRLQREIVTTQFECQTILNQHETSLRALFSFESITGPGGTGICRGAQHQSSQHRMQLTDSLGNALWTLTS